MEALLILPSVILGFLLYREQRRADEAQKAWRLERAGLLNRIQAPEQAVLEAYEPNDVRHLPFDDDEAWWAAQKDGS